MINDANCIYFRLWLLSILLLSLGLHGLGKKSKSNPDPELAKFDEVDDDDKNVTAGTGGFFESETDDLGEYSFSCSANVNN